MLSPFSRSPNRADQDGENTAVDGPATVHASAVLVGPRAVLIRGPSSSGKSRLVWNLLQAAETGLLPFARLVGDDRVRLQACHGRLLVRPAENLQGLLELRRSGLRRLPFEPVAMVGLVVDLAAETERMPPAQAQETVVAGVQLTRLAVASGAEALPLVRAILASNAASDR